METLDERIERLYGPQKRKFHDAVCTESPPQRSYYEELAYLEAQSTLDGLLLNGVVSVDQYRELSPAVGRRTPRTGKEMAEQLLGHSIDKEWYYNQRGG